MLTEAALPQLHQGAERDERHCSLLSVAHRSARGFSGMTGWQRSLNSVTVRGLAKVTVHLFISFIVTAAWAFAMPQSPRQLVRAT